MFYEKAIRTARFEVGATLSMVQDPVKISDIIARTIIPTASDFFEQPLALAIFLRLVMLMAIFDEAPLSVLCRPLTLSLEPLSGRRLWC